MTPTSPQKLIKDIEKEVKELRTKTDLIPELDWRVKAIEKDIEQLMATIKDNNISAVSHIEFEPIRTIVYGLVGLILTAVVVALVGLVVR